MLHVGNNKVEQQKCIFETQGCFSPKLVTLHRAVSACAASRARLLRLRVAGQRRAARKLPLSSGREAKLHAGACTGTPRAAPSPRRFICRCCVEMQVL